MTPLYMRRRDSKKVSGPGYSDVEIHIADQTRIFIGAIVIGLCMGGFYDLLRFIRMLCSGGRLLQALLDVLFCIFCLGGFMLFVLAWGEGKLRFFIPGGVGAGIVLYFMALSPIIIGLYSKIACGFRWLVAFIYKIANKILSPVFRLIVALFSVPRGD